MTRILETQLYQPIKTFLTKQGFEVKAEIGAADLVACRDGLEPIIVELKVGFSLALFHQGVARQSITDAVYIAVARGTGRKFQTALKNNLKLARKLGLGVMCVRVDDGHVEVHCDPAPYAPRKSKRRKDHLLKEFSRRIGDPNVGGSTRTTLVTAYRQDAICCAEFLATHGPSKGATIAKATQITRATRIMADDYYGWFERVERGIYGLTTKGLEAREES